MANTKGQKKLPVVEPVEQEIRETLGARMRQLRKSRGLSMQQVAERADLSVGLISQIERGLTSPSIRTLKLMALALDMPLEGFFTRPETPSSQDAGCVVRPRTRQVLNLEHTGMSVQIISPECGGSMQMILSDLKPGGHSGHKMDRHEGEEAGLVLFGQLELWIGDEHFHLFEGDTFQFSSLTPHRYCNPGEMTTRIHWTVSPPLYSMRGKLLYPEGHFDQHASPDDD